MRLNFPCAYRVVYVAAQVACAALVSLVACSVARAADDSWRDSPRDFVRDHKYYAMPDLAEAARLLRAEAAGAEVDENEVPAKPAVALFASGPDRISLPASPYYYPDYSDTTYITGLRRDRDTVAGTEEETVILVCTRELTINEVAGIMERGIRIYDFFRAIADTRLQFGGFIVRGTRHSLAALTGEPYARWMTPYTSEEKCPVCRTLVGREDLVASGFYNHVSESEIAEIRATGVDVQYADTTTKWIYFSAAREGTEKVASLPWVKKVLVAGSPSSYAR